tara:strand:- start:42 stop:827 length:786 start_codon:yes stop_codon:yes gene_type:complete
MNRISPTVKQLLIINIIFFFGTINLDSLNKILSLHFPEYFQFDFWQIISHMFMHGNHIHLLFNMFALWMFGTAVESIFGSRRFLFFYITSGLGAAIAQIAYFYFIYYSNLEILINAGYNSYDVLTVLNKGVVVETPEGFSIINPDPLFQTFRNILEINAQEFIESFYMSMVGASGAIMGVLVAFGMLFPESKLMLLFIPFPVKAKYFIPGIIILDLISAITGYSFFSPSNTAYIAHVGGAITGFFIMYYWKKNRFNQNRWY